MTKNGTFRIFFFDKSGACASLVFFFSKFKQSSVAKSIITRTVAFEDMSCIRSSNVTIWLFKLSPKTELMFDFNSSNLQ